MIDTLLSIQSILGYPLVISFFACIILGIRISVLRKTNDLFELTKNKPFNYFLFSTVFIFLWVVFLNISVENLLFKEVKTELSSLSSIYINNKKVLSSSLAKDFQNISEPSQARNNGKLELNVIVINSNHTVELMLLRDFNIATKYWVYYQKYKKSRNNCIGEINTSLLNDY